MADTLTLARKRADNKLIIRALESRHVPFVGLEKFTVGEHFRVLVNRLEDELISLSKEPQYKEYLVQAPFGGGKTHFLQYIAELIQNNNSQNSIISLVDMTKVVSETDFELQVIRGIQSPKGKSYGDVLRATYNRFSQKLFEDKTNISQRNLHALFEMFLYFILGKVSHGVINKTVLDFFGSTNPIGKITDYLSGRTVAVAIKEARLNSSAPIVEFVSSYMHIIKDNLAPLSRFDEACVYLAREHRLGDVLFRMFKWAGYKSVVILVDELETLQRFNEIQQKQILTSIREFRDEFKFVGYEGGYPSAALIIASTMDFAEQLGVLEPALSTRLYNREQLDPLGIPDVDFLLFKLRNLFYEAGYKLKPLTNDEEHEIISMRRIIIDEIGGLNLYPRRVVTELIKKIKTDWVI